MKAIELLDKLRKTIWRDDAHAWLYEVGNATGWAANRHADALVVSCWPSRGLWVAGIEVKVSRSDWLRELKDPQKSDDIQAHCHFWWLVTTPGIVREGELPVTWGLIEVDKKHKIIKQAPRLKPVALSMEFLAAVLRNQSKAVDALVSHRVIEKVKERVENMDAQAKEYTDKLRELKPNTELQSAYDELKADVEKFGEATGIRLEGRWHDDVGTNIRLVEVARKLNGYRGLSMLRNSLKQVDETLAELDTDPKSQAAQ
jgi:hypothetical protein